VTLNGRVVERAGALDGAAAGSQLATVPLGFLPMGRTVLTVSAEPGTGPFALDGFWLTDGPQFIMNALDAEGRAVAPAEPLSIPVTAGRHEVAGIPFETLPAGTGRDAVVRVAPGESVAIPLPEGAGGRVWLLGGTLDDAPSTVNVAFGDEEPRAQEWPPVYGADAAEAGEDALEVAPGRWLQIIDAGAAGDAGRLTLRAGEEPVVVVAATHALPAP
jgi:hypothetical protein